MSAAAEEVEAPEPDKKRKKARWCCITTEDQPELYIQLEDLVEKYHPDLTDAEIQLEWMLEQKADSDSRMKRGMVKKPSEENVRIHGVDFIFGLNKNWWEAETTTPTQRTFELDTLLCECDAARDQAGDQKSDSFDTLLWRKVKPDFQGFEGPISRFGVQGPELQRATLVIEGAQLNMPFNGPQRKLKAVP